MTFSTALAEDRRLALLQALDGSPGYTSNEYALRGALAGLGHAVAIDQVRADLAWLEERGLVLASSAAPVWVVTLTASGSDVAAGLSRLPGVARPRPL